MNGFRFAKAAAVCLATLGTSFPQVTALGADSSNQTKQAPVKSKRVAPTPDLKMTEGTKISGRVVDHTGTVIEGAQVTLRQDKKELTSTVTDKDGLFSFNEMKNGVYTISSGNTDGLFRVWTENTAPPSAKEHALLVMGENGARGQFGAVDPTLVLLTAGVIAAVVLSAITLDKVNKLNSSQ